jgi:uncharacterized protein
MISSVNDTSEIKEAYESQATALCKACGLCCTGHLFIWAKLRSAELDSAQALGLNVVRDPEQRGFSQPCPLWQGECTIYTSPHYPRFCHTYKCRLLKELVDETTALPEALATVGQAMAMIDELEGLLPASSNSNFRERLVARVEYLEALEKPGDQESQFLLKARALLNLFEKRFGVKDFLDKPADG